MKYTVVKTLGNGNEVDVIRTNNLREAQYVANVLSDRGTNVHIAWHKSVRAKGVA